MARTLTPDVSTKWINDLIEIEAALQAVDDLRTMVPHEIWNRVWIAKVSTRSIRKQLLMHVVADVEIETREKTDA